MTDTRPPRLARWLLKLHLLGARRTEIEIDLLELFELRARTRGERYARRRYYRDVLSLSRGASVHVRDTSSRERSNVLSEIAQDLTYGVRLFRRSPAVVAVTIMGLAVAIGVGTSVFSLLNATALRPTGIIEPSSAVRVLRGFQGGLSNSWPYAEYTQIRDAATTVKLEASLGDAVFFSTKPNTEFAETAHLLFVSGGYLQALNSRVLLGRVLTPSDDVAGASPVAVLSHAFWSRRLGADPAVVGRSIWLNGAAFIVVGVSERGFTGTYDAAPSLWVPIASYHVAVGGPPIDRTSNAGVHVIGRISAETPRDQSQAALSVVAAAIGQSSRETGGERLNGVRFEPAASRTKRGEAAFIALVVAIVLIVIGLVVLLACVNVANLLLASAISRQREMGVRLALGASRSRIVRQLLTESLVLGIAAGAIGLLLTVWLVPILATVINAPAAIDLAPDRRVYLFLSAVSVLAGLGAGLAPARHTLRDDLASPLKGAGVRADGSRRPQRLRATLIGMQAAGSIVLLVLAALLTRGMMRAAHVDIGFEANRLLAISPAFARGTHASSAAIYWDGALERARALPGVQSASLASQSPFGDGSSVTIFERAGSRHTIYHNATTADYFVTLDLRIVRGRTYTTDEVSHRAQVAVISEALAQDFFPGEDPIGQPLDRIISDSRRVIIGVVANVITARLRELGSATVYEPMESPLAASMVLRTTGPPEALTQSVRSALDPIDPRIRLDIKPVSEGLQKQLAEPRALASLAGVLAGIALVLAVVGIYGVTAFVVGQRRQEIGVRIACGANGSDVVRLLLRDSLRPVAFGLAGGVLVALLAGRVFAGVLYGVNSADPVAFVAAVLVLLFSAAGAVMVPTHRAASVEPASVLREL